MRHLSIHPEAVQPTHRLALLRANKDVQSSLAKLEVLKPRLNQRYEIYEQNLKDSAARVNPKFTTVDDDHIHDIASDNRPWLSPPKTVILSSSENAAFKDDNKIAITLAQKDIRRRASTINTLRPIASKQDEQGNLEADGLDDCEDISRNDVQGLHRAVRELQPKTSSFHKQPDRVAQSDLEISYLADDNINSKYRYPEVYRQGASKSRVPGDQLKSPNEEWALKTSNVTQAPDPPPKDQATFALEKRTSSNLTHVTVRDLSDTVEPVKSFTSSSPYKTSAFTFKYSACLENGTFLRTVFLPPSLRISFLSIALPNTRANLETCGILCGTLISNALFISKLVIPDQESTSDTCETINEDKLFDYVDGEDLMVLGWIHTHPTQTCFMSSRDLHTHAGYQAMMPESIAIVCAPSKGECVYKLRFIRFEKLTKGRWGVFRLTDPPGLSAILKCNQTGLFHPHADNNIYTDASRPGHVHEAKGLDFDIIDLRVTN